MVNVLQLGCATLWVFVAFYKVTHCSFILEDSDVSSGMTVGLVLIIDSVLLLKSVLLSFSDLFPIYCRLLPGDF